MAGREHGEVRARGYRRLPSAKRTTSDKFPISVAQRANDLRTHIVE
jgi:hypothetical protein